MNARQDHDRFDELLPWLANGTLEGEEAEELSRHVAGCVTCRRGLAEWKLVGETVAADGRTRASAERSFERLRERMEPAGETTGRMSRWRWVAPLAAAAGFVALLVWLPSGGPSDGPPFRTLNDPAVTIDSAAPLARVLFDQRTSEADLRALLREVGGEIVAGPSPVGLYTVALPEDADAESLVRRLRAAPSVRFAELADR